MNPSHIYTLTGIYIYMVMDKTLTHKSKKNIVNRAYNTGTVGFRY